MPTYYLRTITQGTYLVPTPVKAKDIDDLRRKLCEGKKIPTTFVYTRPDANNSSLSGVLDRRRSGEITWDVKGKSESILDVDPRTGKVIRARPEELFTFSVTSLDYMDNKSYGEFTEVLPNFSEARKMAIKKVISKDHSKQVLIIIAYKRLGGHLYCQNGRYIWSDKGVKTTVDPRTGNLARGS